MNQERVTVGETHTGNTMDAGGPVTTIVTWEIQEGREKQFETWRHEIEAAATKFPGHLGVKITDPESILLFFASIRLRISLLGKNPIFVEIC